MPPVIQVRSLTKTYRSQSQLVHALNGIDLDVEEGEVLGILGPNGAGKTTFLNSLSTLLLPDSGQIQILGIESTPKNFSVIRRLINMSSGYPNYAFSLSVRENLSFYGRLYGLSGTALEKKLDEVIELFALKEYAHRRFDELSSGTKQRLSLAKSLLNDPKVLFLDEPTIGLDPDVALKTRHIVKEILKQKKVTVLLTSHNMDEVEDMCQRVAFIQKGQIVKLSSISELKRLHHTDDLEQVFIQLAASTNQGLSSPNVLVGDLEVANPGFPTKAFGNDNLIKAWLNRCFAFTFRSALFAIRNLFVMTDLFFWPMISLVSIGLMAKFVNLNEGLLAFVMTGTLAAGVLQIVQLDVGYTVLYELWSKSLKHTLLTPIGVTEGVFGTWVAGMARGLFAFGLLAIAASWGFGFHLPGFWITTLFLLGLFICALLLGILVNILILSFGQKVEITAWMFAHLFMILCGIYYPVNILPPFFQSVALMIPITHFLEFFRQSYGFKAHSTHPLFIGFALSGIYLWLFLRFLANAYTRARRKGIVIRLSE
ncbi:MAG: ABC transporter ATP-binding protein/permease [Candidatus Omnitrophica bacterium]|nr:ABC transporter ATP-binding protein/permease [Candidatus Omnitrophota bacterium]